MGVVEIVCCDLSVSAISGSGWEGTLVGIRLSTEGVSFVVIFCGGFMAGGASSRSPSSRINDGSLVDAGAGEVVAVGLSMSAAGSASEIGELQAAIIRKGTV